MCRPFVTGMPHHTRAPSGSPVFRIAAAGELGTSRVPALSVILMPEEGDTVGLGACGGGGFVRVCPVVLALASRRTTHIYDDVERGLRGSGGFPRIRNPCVSASSAQSVFYFTVFSLNYTFSTFFR
ncbi:MAG: hypothetical protein ABIH80_00930 [Methanobacteriota archaeon]